MKKIVSFLIVGACLILTSCANGQSPEDSVALDPTAFSQKIEATPGAVVLDVRTPDEFGKGHLKNAVNFNWNDKSFSDQVSKMDKESPVFVYCLSGGRSASAAKSLRAKGFKQVYEMTGGIMKWRAAGLPLQTDAPAVASEMSLADFEKAIHSSKKVLLDFYADWCGPCKKMEPYLKEIAQEKSAELVLLCIDVDAHPDLAAALKVEALPVLHLYQDGKQQWVQTGYITKEEVLKKL